MKGGVILFIVEGPSDQDAITAFIAKEVLEQNIKVTVKVMHGDILTRYDEHTKDYSIHSGNVKGEVKKLILDYLNSPSVKSSHIRVNDIKKVYYMTDTDNCFLKEEVHSINKKECLRKMFNFEEIELSKNKKTEFETIFFAHNLEHVIDKNSNKLSDKEKEKIASDFAVESLLNREYFIKAFTTSLMTWNSFEESYKEIQTYEDRASNMNNLLDEIEKWKQEQNNHYLK